MSYEVEITDEFVEWWETLSEDEQEELSARVALLERLGPTMRRPYSGEIVGSEFDPRMKGAHLRRRSSSFASALHVRLASNCNLAVRRRQDWTVA